MDIDIIARQVQEHHDFLTEHADTITWLKEHLPFMEWLKERHDEWVKDVEGAKREADDQAFGQKPDAPPADGDAPPPDASPPAEHPSDFPPPDSPETGDRPEGEAPEDAVVSSTSFTGTVSGHLVEDATELQVHDGGKRHDPEPEPEHHEDALVSTDTPPEEIH